MTRGRLLATGAATTAMLAARPAGAVLSRPQRDVLRRYLDAFVARRYDAAFALLSDDERRYFQNAANLASVYAADRFRLVSYRIIESKVAPPLGAVAVVLERIEFFDAARQSPASATAKVVYGIVPGKNGLRVKDPGHPWRVIAPSSLGGTLNGVAVTIRKIAFYTGRIELVATFQNRADRVVTLLPYGRSVLQDDAGKIYQPIESRLSSLTDKTLYTGLRLPSSAQYTGAIAFFTPDRFRPKTLTLTIGPALFDGADEPFAIDVATFAVPAS
jgi:hypothetical protein